MKKRNVVWNKKKGKKMKLKNCKVGMRVNAEGLRYELDFVISAVYAKTVCLYSPLWRLTIHFVRPKYLKKAK